MAIIVTGYTRYGPLPSSPGPTTTSTTTSTTTVAPTTTSTTTTTTTAGAGTTTTTSTTTTTTTAAPINVNVTIYNDACTQTGTIVVLPDAASVGLYYRIDTDVIYYVNNFTNDPYSNVQTMGTGYALCPPPA